MLLNKLEEEQTMDKEIRLTPRDINIQEECNNYRLFRRGPAIHTHNMMAVPTNVIDVYIRWTEFEWIKGSRPRLKMIEMGVRQLIPMLV
jgi:hypothetical protein